MKKAFCLAVLVTLLFAVGGFAQLTTTTPDNAPKVGDTAPDFAIPKGMTTVDATSLKDFVGKKRVLLMFFPGAFTRGCTQEFTEAGQMNDKITGMNIEMIGVSRDLPGALSKFKETVGAKNAFVSDPELSVISKYDAVNPGRVAKRYYFLIDDKGKVIWRSVTGQLIPTDKLIADLGQLLQGSN